MANSTSNKIILLLIFILFFFFTFFIACEARDLHGNESMQKNKKVIQSKLLLHELGFDESKLEEYRRRFLHVGSDRVAPGGPDSHHHSLPPF